MIQTILLDMDDTLLKNEALSFFQGYVRLLAPHVAPWMNEQELYALMGQTSRAMMTNQDAAKTLLEVFWEAVAAAGYPAAAIALAFDDFYARSYPRLAEQMSPMPDAVPLLEWLRDEGYQLVIATGPLFPEAAIRQRLEWGGVADMPYALITSCENMHYAKPDLRYYEEVLALLGRRADECVMVGNDPSFDMVAGQLGIKTYLVTNGPVPDAVAATVDGYGALAGLRPWLDAERR